MRWEMNGWKLPNGDRLDGMFHEKRLVKVEELLSLRHNHPRPVWISLAPPHVPETMHTNRISMQTAPPISPLHSYTIDDGDDSDICPVCDGECTCTKPVSLPPPTPGVPLSMAELSLRYASASSPIPPPKPKPYHAPPAAPSPQQPPKPRPSLKIKLTVPQSMLAKHRAPSAASTANTSQTTSDVAVAGYQTPPAPGPSNHPNAYIHQSHSQRPSSAPKKRGRPPKPLGADSSLSPPATTSRPYKPLPPKSTLSAKFKKRPSSTPTSTKPRQNLKARAAGVKKAVAAKRRRVVSSDDESSDDDSSDDIDMGQEHLSRRAGYATKSNIVAAHLPSEGDFPTFVSASAISSISSDSSDFSSELSSLDDSDASIEAEEENFIVADVQHRMKRDHGDDPLLHPKKRAPHNNDWIIRARKKSEGPSDVEMDVDSDATEDDDDEEDIPEEADDDEDATEEDVTMIPAFGPSVDGEEDAGTTTDDHRYVGHATGWSEDDDESSFDADLFFANLSDSGSSTSSSCSSMRSRHRRLETPFSMSTSVAGTPMSMSLGEEGDQSDISGACSDTTEAPRARRAQLESLPFEVTEGWDGAVIFTNGKADGPGVVDLAFEDAAERFGFVVDERGKRHAYPYENLSLEGPADGAGAWMGAAADVFGTLGGGGSEDEAMSDGGYEEEDGEGEGDTTDEELVGEDDLPNARAMRLFSLPLSVSAINPLSTVSSPVSSPRGAGGDGGYTSRRRHGHERERELVRPADILAGRVVFWDSDEMEHDRDDGGILSARQARVWGARRDLKELRELKEKERRRDERVRRRMRRMEVDVKEEEEEGEEDEGMRAGGEEAEESRKTRRRRAGAGSGGEDSGANESSGDGGRSSASEVGRRRSLSAASFNRGPRKGVFVPPTEVRLAVIAEDKKGADVPSPHPRFNRRGRGRGSAVEHLLRRHLLQSLTAANISTASGLALNNSLSIPAPAVLLPSSSSTPSSPSMHTPANERSPFEQLLLASAAGQTVPASPASGSVVDPTNTPMMLCDPPHVEAEVIELDDVLEASFLDDPFSSANAGSGAAPASAASGSTDARTTGDGTGAGSETDDAKNLSRWDLISVGAFRQTRERAWDASVTGNAIRSAPLAAMMWQQNNAPSVGSMGMGARTSSSTSLKSSKLAKRRKLMMSASTMSSPLILPSASAAAFNGGGAMSAPGSASTSSFLSASKSHAGSPMHQDDGAKRDQQQQQKSRKEVRRERKLLKRSSTGSGVQAHHHTHHGFGQHGHGAHQFHAHHHHPNSKTRSTGSTQRSGGFLAGVPPLNL